MNTSAPQSSTAPRLSPPALLDVRSSLQVHKGVAAGIGLGEMPVWMGEREGLVRIWPARHRANDYEVWQVMHPDLQRTARVRATAEFLSEAFQIG